jgi:hypothetical protein
MLKKRGKKSFENLGDKLEEGFCQGCSRNL